MLVAIFLLLIVVPVVELFVIVQVADSIGVLATVLFLVLVSVAGAWLVKREGLGVIRRVQDQLSRGEIPTDTLVDGLVIMVAGAMLLFPGFVTDALGLLLLVPPLRALVRKVVLSRFRSRLATPGPGRVYNVSSVQYVRSTYDPAPDTDPDPVSAPGLDGGRELGRGSPRP